MSKLDRREFLGSIAAIGGAIFLGGHSANGAAGVAGVSSRKSRFDPKILAVASDGTPAELTVRAIKALGGIDKLVRKGDFVVIKPNIAWNRPPNAAATTNPSVVGALVKLCKEAKAGRILVVDHIIDRPAEAVMDISEIGPTAERHGAETLAAQNESDFRKISIPKGKVLKTDTCIKELAKADVFINVPIAKVHGGTTLTLGMKNLMGCIWDRQAWHASPSLNQCIADYATAVRPDLIVLDANKILLTNGPKGPGKMKNVGKVIVGTDQVAIDAYGATLFGLKPDKIAHIKLAHGLKVGEIDLSKVRIKNA